jgi:hypothetical protein
MEELLLKHDHIGERDRAHKRDHVIRTAEWVLRKIYRKATGPEIIASRNRINEIIHKEACRRSR